MPELKNKTILILSPQSWGKMFISKHHYAIELAKRGNKVYFLNPPEKLKTDQNEPVIIITSGIQKNLFLIEHCLFFPYRLKFHAIPLFHLLMRYHIKKILKKIPQPVDIIWSFDLGNLYPFRFFSRGAYKIFHPVDEPLNKTAINSVRGAQVIFSVTNEILEKYQRYNIPKHFINHGVSDNFLFSSGINQHTSDIVHIGFSGNLLRNDIDRDTLLQIIEENPDFIFDFWGAFKIEQSNIGGTIDITTESFINKLHKQKNVILHGVVSSPELAQAIHKMSAFLICYDVEKDQSKGTNYHKLMEYFSTGKVVVSNNITTYKNHPELVQMTEERDHNKSLPILFKKVVNNLTDYNAPAVQILRVAFAADNTYSKQIERIAALID